MTCSEGGWEIHILISVSSPPTPNAPQSSPSTSHWRDPAQLEGRGSWDVVTTGQCLGVQSVIGRDAKQN